MPDVIRGFIEDGVVKRYDYDALANKPAVDSTLSVEGGFADAKAVGDTIRSGLNLPTVPLGTVNGMLGVAESYFNYAYNTVPSGFLYRHAWESPKSLFATTVDSQVTDGVTQYGINCSSFVHTLLSAIPFKNSRYLLGSSKENISLEWGNKLNGIVADSAYNMTYARDMAEYAFKYGFLYSINSFSDIRAGDIVFVCATDSTSLHDITHVEMALGATADILHVIESSDTAKRFDVVEDCDVGLRIHTVNPSSAYGQRHKYAARFPLGDAAVMPELRYTTTESATYTVNDTFITRMTNVDDRAGFYTIIVKGSVPGTPYISHLPDGGSTLFRMANMLTDGTGTYYLTTYLKDATNVQLRTTGAAGATCTIDSIQIWKGYQTVDGTAASSQAVQNDVAVLKSIFGLGTIVPSGSDLDDYTTPGGYSVSTNATAQTVSNVPEASGGKLIVLHTVSTARHVQLYITNTSTPRFYVRSNTGQWNPWSLLSATAQE